MATTRKALKLQPMGLDFSHIEYRKLKQEVNKPSIDRETFMEFGGPVQRESTKAVLNAAYDHYVACCQHGPGKALAALDKMIRLKLRIMA